LADEVSGTVSTLPGPLASAEARPADSPAKARDLAADRAHAEYCPGCKASVETLVAAEIRFRKMISTIAIPTESEAQADRGADRERPLRECPPQECPPPACPPEDTWARVATGLIPDREAAPWIAHAAECEFCGPLLREATEDLAVEATPEELNQVREMITPEWRLRMARSMSAASGAGFSGEIPPEGAQEAGSAEPQPRGGWLDWLRRRGK
jgi:hypothetical protein